MSSKPNGERRWKLTDSVRIFDRPCAVKGPRLDPWETVEVMPVAEHKDAVSGLFMHLSAEIADGDVIREAAQVIVDECDAYGPGSLPPTLAALDALRAALATNEREDENMDKGELPEDVLRVVALVESAKEMKHRADLADKAHKKAIDRLVAAVGGDGLAAIRNGEQRIGELITKARGY